MVQLHHVWVVWPERSPPPDHNRPDGTSFNEITKPRLSVRKIKLRECIDDGTEAGLTTIEANAALHRLPCLGPGAQSTNLAELSQ